jgi:hypothetical protein
MRLTGGCLCGRVRYEAEILPNDVADWCFCGQCRKASGAASLPWVQVAPGRFVVTQGEARGFASSPHSTRWFCPQCGTPLYMTDDAGRSVGITLGSLDGPGLVPPTVQGWVGSRVGWAKPDPDLPSFEDAPPYDL